MEFDFIVDFVVLGEIWFGCFLNDFDFGERGCGGDFVGNLDYLVLRLKSFDFV